MCYWNHVFVYFTLFVSRSQPSLGLLMTGSSYPKVLKLIAVVTILLNGAAMEREIANSKHHTEWPLILRIMFLTDLDNFRVQKFDSNGSFKTKWSSEGLGDGQFSKVTPGIDVDTKGYVYIVNKEGANVQNLATMVCL